MTRRERMERRLERRTDWAASRRAQADAGFQKAHDTVAGIPFGQPILVGHHSEGRHRAALKRSDNAMRAACESADMATHHASKAAGIERQLDRSIYSDDPDAPERIAERIAALEAKRDAMKRANAAYRKGDAAFAACLGITLEQAAARRVTIEAGYSWCRQPHPAYELQNLGGNITRLRKRLVDIEHRATRQQAAEDAGGVTIVGDDYVNVTFAEKPERAILDALKAAGFHWRGGTWGGYRDKIPAAVLALATP